MIRGSGLWTGRCRRIGRDRDLVRSLQPLHTAHLPRHKDHRQRRGRQIRHRGGVHDPVDAQEHGQDDDQRQQEQNLPGQGDKDTLFRLSDGSEEVGRDGLDSVQEGEKQEDAEILLRKVVVFLAAGAEDLDDLAGEQLEAEEGAGGDRGGEPCGL